jgi:membrane-bound serine protease (ClpP class)
VGWLLLWVAFAAFGIELLTLRGIAALVGVGALMWFFASQPAIVVGNPTYLVIAVAGLVGLLVEFHVMPGSGVPGVLGICALLVAVTLSFGPDSLGPAAEELGIATVLTIVTMLVMVRVLPRNVRSSRLAFLSSQGKDYVASLDHRSLLGRQGKAISSLRPSGVADIAGERVDVLTEGGYITAGSLIRVTKVEGARIFVDVLPKDLISKESA